MEQFSEQFSASYQSLTEKISGWLDTLIVNVPNLILALVVGGIAFFASRYIRKVAGKAALKMTANRTIQNLAANLASVLFGVVILFVILGIFNLNGTINKLLATAGVLGLAVGLALQDPMNNLFSGVFMSVRDLYRIGDLVETNGYFGKISNIDLRATKIKLPTGEEVVIPNKDVIQNPLKNYSSAGERRIDLPCGVSYGDDLDHVEKIAVEAIKNLDGIDLQKPVEVIYTSFGDSSINFNVRYWLSDPTLKDFLVEKSKGIKAIKKAFDQHDISIPFPIRTLDFGIKGGTPLRSMLRSKIQNGTKQQFSKQQISQS